MPSRDPRFYVDAEGAYIGAFDGAEPPAGAIEVPRAPVDARQRWNGSSFDPVPPPGYRDLRMVDYARELGKDPGDIIKTLGDVLDVTIAELVARGSPVTPEFGAMLVKIAAIKARHPKGSGE